MSTPNRREFVQTLALTAGVPALALGWTEVSEGAQNDVNSRADVARLLTEVIRARHGKTLDEEKLKNIQGRIAGSLGSARVLQNMNLANADEPDFVVFAGDVAG